MDLEQGRESERETSASSVAEGLARTIHELRLAPGAKLSEDEVGEIFGVSRTIVRAALQELSHGRLVELKRNRGAFVALHRHIEAKHAALAEGSAGRALFLSGAFHVEIARIADQDTIKAFVEQLVARSSLIIALYWRRRQALCESHAHHDLIGAIAARDGAVAEELMKSHLLDLLTSLDVKSTRTVPGSLREALD